MSAMWPGCPQWIAGSRAPLDSIRPGAARAPLARVVRCLVGSVLAAWVLLAWPGLVRAATTRSLIAEVTQVADGSTVTVVDTGQATHRIRLLGIEVPGATPRRPADRSVAEEARQFLDQLLARKFVRAEVYGADRQHALLGVIFDGPFNVNLLLVSMGYARVPRNARCESYCRALQDAEAKAVRDTVGMWQQPSGLRNRTPAHGS